MITYEKIKNNPAVKVYIEEANRALHALGYTEHGFAHVTKVATLAGDILEKLGHDAHTVDLAKIAGYMHDIGNIINRVDHSQSGAVMAFRILDKEGMDPLDLSRVVSAIGNHDEGTGMPVNEIAAALIIADKSDVRRSRVRNDDKSTFDIHDRVNYSVYSTDLDLDKDTKKLTLRLDVDTAYGSVMDFFEIFHTRMVMCKNAALTLGLSFGITINGQSVM
ncbi:MAG: HD domain-containing protein [Clostridia bacterium]|nr:HD domain-containing protein [Clostridia bacterium]